MLTNPSRPRVVSEFSQLCSIVDEGNFLLATRESGYRDVVWAVAELIDNSIQAGASRVFIDLRRNRATNDLELNVIDDGLGMSASALHHALQFGGTERFGDRQGFGRFGMGLPNASLSQARRLDVITWRGSGEVYTTYLDVDECISRLRPRIEAAQRTSFERWNIEPLGETGTLIRWTKCDRLVKLDTKTIVHRLNRGISRLFRYGIWDGIAIHINGDTVVARDPLFLDTRAQVHGATVYEKPIEYSVASPTGSSGTIRVRFTELPVERWHKWDAKTKRELDISRGAGISVVRADREIDHGWFFMGSKRKENYDDWWRCEIMFPAFLDELFGVTSNKQGIRPCDALKQILSPDLESIGRVLNRRVRGRFDALRRCGPSKASLKATESDEFLALATPKPHSGPAADLSYCVDYGFSESADFYTASVTDGRMTLKLNKEHPFFQKLYGPALEGENKAVLYAIEMLLLSLARAENAMAGTITDPAFEHRAKLWSDVLATFLST